MQISRIHTQKELISRCEDRSDPTVTSANANSTWKRSGSGPIPLQHWWASLTDVRSANRSEQGSKCHKQISAGKAKLTELLLRIRYMWISQYQWAIPKACQNALCTIISRNSRHDCVEKDHELERKKGLTTRHVSLEIWHG